MNTVKIKKDLSLLKTELRTRINYLTQKKVSEITGILQPDISAWMSSKRNWSWEKIIKIYDKIEE